MKIVWETRKILGDDSIRVDATTVRIAVFYEHSASVHLETRPKTGADRARQDFSHECGVDMWIVADNVRQATALNSVQIAEHLINNIM